MFLSKIHIKARRGRAVVIATTAALLALSACGGGGSDSSDGAAKPDAVSQAQIDKAMKTPTDLTFWTWVPNIDKEVALFEKKYPAINVKVVNVGQGPTHYKKLRTALTAGSGTPDVAQVEFQYIPTFALTNSLVDLRPYGAEERKADFVDWTWKQVSGQDGQVWAFPQDTGPMGMLYRKDLFDKYGIAPPKTWDEFAAAAHKLHEADPSLYITDIAPNEGPGYMGLMWQAGARPFDVTGKDKVGINLNDAASKKVGAYWEGLAKDGVIATDPAWTDAWFQGLARGKYATWLTAAWGPVFLQGSAKNTSGRWRAAPLPQWKEGDSVSGNWGGSTDAVIKGTKNPIASAKLAEFINSDSESTKMLTTEQFLYPATKALLNDPSFTDQKPAFYGGQMVNKLFADISGTVSGDFQWPSFFDQTVSDWTETVGTALSSKGDVSAGLDAWQKRISTYADNQGFTVSTK